MRLAVSVDQHQRGAAQEGSMFRTSRPRVFRDNASCAATPGASGSRVAGSGGASFQTELAGFHANLLPAFTAEYGQRDIRARA